MNSEPKASSSDIPAPYDAPFKILSEKQLEWMQFKAKQKLLELKEEEEWKKYCQEQIFSDAEHHTITEEKPLNTDGDVTNKTTGNIEKSICTEQTVQQKRKIKGAKKPVVVHQNKGKGTQYETRPPIQISHFQKTRVERPFSLSASGKLNVLKVEKRDSIDNVFSGNSDGGGNGNDAQSAVPVWQRTVQTVDSQDLEYDELSRDLNEILLCPHVNRSIGFSLPYVLKQQHDLTRKAYAPSFPKPNIRIRHKKIPIPSYKRTSGISSSKRNPVGTTVSKNINSKVQNPSTSKARNLKVQENIINTKSEKENIKEKTKSVSVKGKKLNKLQKDVSKKVFELVLDGILDEIISKVEYEEEEKRKRFIHGQLNNILQKLNDIENEESAIHRKWETFTVQKPHKEDASVTHSPLSVDIPESSGAVQEKFVQSTVDAIFRDALKDSEVGVYHINSETTTSLRISGLQNSAAAKHLPEDAEVLHQHPTQQNLMLAEVGKKTVALSGTSDVLNFRSERDVGITSESMQRIYDYKKRFRQYLKQSSQISKEHCDFWNVSTETADQILEECLQEVAEELCEIPSSLIVDLYNQEFEHSYVQS